MGNPTRKVVVKSGNGTENLCTGLGSTRRGRITTAMAGALLLVVTSWVPTSAAAPPARDRLTREVEIARQLGLKAASLQTISIDVGVNGALSAEVEIEGVRRRLVLAPHSVRSANFEVLVQRGPDGQFESVTPPAVATYRGTIVGVPGSAVSGSFVGEGLSATLLTPNGVFGLQPIGKLGLAGEADEHVVYRRDAWLHAGVHVCGSDGWSGLLPAPTESNLASSAGSGLKIAEVAIDTDFEFFQLNGSRVEDTVIDVETVMDAVEAIYERDTGITYEVTRIIVRPAEPDPYTSTDVLTLLCQLRAEWNAAPLSSVPRDVAHLLTGKDIDFNIIGAAFGGTLCNLQARVNGCPGGRDDVAYGFSQSLFTPFLGSRVSLTAHELGHSWGAAHCDTDSNSCHIMCSGLGACEGIFGDNLKFGVQASNSITSFRDSAGCLDDLGLGQAVPFTDEFPSITLDANKWSYAQNTIVSSTGTDEPSAPFALRFDGGPSGDFREADARTNVMDLSVTDTASAAYQVQAAAVGTGDSLVVDYWSSAFTWRELDRVTSDGVAQSVFIPRFRSIPADGLHAEFRIRFRTEGSGASAVWFVDDLRVSGGCVVDQQCADGVVCTIDFCNTTRGACDRLPDNALCDDGVFCNGAEFCSVSTGCENGPEPCLDTVCLEETNSCSVCVSDADCDDGTFCNGTERCLGGDCVPGAQPCAAGAMCDPVLGHCVDATACPAPTVLADSSRYLSVTPAPGLDPVGLLVTPLCQPLGAAFINAPSGSANLAQLLDPGTALLLTPDEWGGPLHVTGENITPDTDFLVWSVCDLSGEQVFSPTVTAHTGVWGDVTGSFVDGAWSAPDGTVAVTSDIVAILDGFQNLPTALPIHRVDLVGLGPGGRQCGADGSIDIIDVTAALDGFAGLGFTETTGCSAPCP